VSELLVEVLCSECSLASRVSPAFVGQSGKCPGCLVEVAVSDPDGQVEGSAQTSWVSEANDVSVSEAPGSHTKPCAACGEAIRMLARRCPLCGEYQNDRDRLAFRAISGRSVLPVAAVRKRVAAAAINAALFAPVFALLTPLQMALDSDNPHVGLIVLGVGLACLGFGVYVLGQWHLINRYGANLGKRWVGIRVVRLDGSQAAFIDGVVLREVVPLALVVLLAPCGVGLLLVPITCAMLLAGDRRGLHDLLAGTIVIEASDD
jgi:uncharacterized RDD family membrane protein YckC